MKKGLLSILAGALLVVGCQNYDDQFDALETQINSLTATVAGLAQVQSDLTSLAGTVSSLASTVNSLGDTIDTAVADGLTDIQADIDAIEAAVADVASSEEVTALQDAVDASQDDLEQLLANSSVFTGPVVVNSVATLDAFHQMKGSLGIVNGDVTITVSEEMDQAKVQELVDAMLTIIGDLSYTSNSSSIAETTFNNLTGVTSITATQAGGYQFQSLTSASNIRLYDNYESTVTVIHFGALTTVDNFYTDTTEDIIEFTKATELHLTSLGRYSTTSAKPLKLIIDEGGALPLAIDDVAADGDQEDLYLEITGPDAITFDNIEDGQLTFTDVKAVTVNGFLGTIVTNGGVESLTADSVVNAPTLGADLENITLTGVADADDSDDTHGPSITIDDQDNLETITLAGKLGAITLSDNDNLTDITISADVDGAITIGVDTAGNAANNSDLVNVTLTGSKATGVTVSNNAELESLTIDTTMQAGTADDAVLDGSVVVKDNGALASLTISSSGLETLTITGNDDLTTIDGTGIVAIGATGEPTVTIEDNDLTATASVDAEDSTATADGAASTDLGSISTDSGMDTLKTYLALVAADADSSAEVYFDTVESYTNESDTEVTDQIWVDGAVPTANKVLVLTPAVIDSGTATRKGKKSYIIGTPTSGDELALRTGESFNIFSGGTGIYDSTDSSAISLTGNTTLDIARITDAAHVTRAAANDITLTAQQGGFSVVSFTMYEINGGTSTTTAQGQRYTTAQTQEINVLVASATLSGLVSQTLGADDYISLTVGGNTVTATGVADGASDSLTLEDALQDAWTARYSSASGYKSSTTVFTLRSSVSGTLTIVGLDQGSRGHGLDVSASVTAGTTDTYTTGKALDWKIGTSVLTQDDETTAENIIVTLESTTAGGGVLNGVASITITTSGTSSITTLNSTQYATGAATNYAAQAEARDDVRSADDGEPDVTTTAAVSFSRVHWL